MSTTTTSNNSGWSQVYVSGLAPSLEPGDDELEATMADQYALSTQDWAGPGTSIVKRMDDGTCRGYAFLFFLSADGANRAIETINAAAGNDHHHHHHLKAELAKPKKRPPKKNHNNKQDDVPDLRFRRRRKAPVAKHPVIVSSNGQRTGLGNKTR